jgi:hypothetical protein
MPWSSGLRAAGRGPESSGCGTPCRHAPGFVCAMFGRGIARIPAAPGLLWRFDRSRFVRACISRISGAMRARDWLRFSKKSRILHWGSFGSRVCSVSHRDRFAPAGPDWLSRGPVSGKVAMASGFLRMIHTIVALPAQARARTAVGAGTMEAAAALAAGGPRKPRQKHTPGHAKRRAAES